MANDLLEHNTINRPLSDVHVKRIVNQILTDRWHFNGDTIKISRDGSILDGQHRLWAVIESKKSIQTAIVRGIESEAFSTIDTIRRTRSGADVLALSGERQNRQALAAALGWLLRWQRGALTNFRQPVNKIENSDIEDAYHAHPTMVHAVIRASRLRRLCNVGIMAFMYYAISNRDPFLAERMMATLENPQHTGINDPFFRLRAYFTADHHISKDPLLTIALTIKAANAASEGKQMTVLKWVAQGKTAEEFPRLKISRPHDAKKAH